MKTIPTDSAYTGFSVAHASEYTTTLYAESAPSRAVLEDQVDHSKTHSQSGEVRLFKLFNFVLFNEFIHYHYFFL